MILIEHGPGGDPALFQHPREVILAGRPADVSRALARAEAARAAGAWVAGYVAYEAGYALEAKLRPLTPRRRSGPLLALGVFCTGFAYILFFRLIARAGPQRALTVTFLVPVFAVAYGAVFLHEAITPWMLMCAAIIVCGLLSWLAARQGLAPLREMKSRAAVVTGQKLSERMPVEAVPVEMADLAQELNRMLDRLQEDFQRLTDFASDLAHELRTPISNLLTQTQVALTTKRDAATYRDILASNAEEFQRLARMVSDMLFLAKTERGVDLPHKERFSARQDALALLEFYEAVAEEKRIRLQLKGDGEVEGDRLMFRRAVSNLLSNALRYTPEAGDITIRITSTAQTTTVAVENTGTDIDAKILPRLFDRFYRSVEMRSKPGSGLGLSIVEKTVQRMGGKFSLVNTTSGGLAARSDEITGLYGSFGLMLRF